MVIILNTKIAKSAQNNRFQSSSSPKAGCYIGNWRTGIYRISFNPRSRAGSDILARLRWMMFDTFQSTLPRGERRNNFRRAKKWIMFQSTLPRGERLITWEGRNGQTGFNPRSRAGSDKQSFACHLISSCFNPRSRAGSD